MVTRWATVHRQRKRKCIRGQCICRHRPARPESHREKAHGENTAGMLDNIDVVHWVITSSNECVDVITEREPTVDIL